MKVNNELTVSHQELLRFINEVLEKKAVPKRQAKLISETLVAANLRGVDTHGIIRLPIYLKRIDEGSLRSKAHVTVIRETSTIAILDGHQSFGQVTGYRAMTLAIEKAMNRGVGVVGVSNSEHFGTAAFFAMMALKKNMIGISMTNTAPIMSPAGGSEKLIGNNPIAFAIPAGKEFPVVLDISMSVAALGKIILASQKGKKVPSGWGKDKAGNLTEDPTAILQGGSLVPMGDHKGYGLAVIFDILCGVLTGSGFTTDVLSIYKDVDKPNRCGHFMMALKIKEFMPVSHFKKRMENMVKQIRGSVKAEGVERIYLPGEIEYLMERERVKNGVPIEKSLVKTLNSISLVAELKVKPLSAI